MGARSRVFRACSRRGLALLTGIAAECSLLAAAHAQPSDERPAGDQAGPLITPPRLITESPPLYPAEALATPGAPDAVDVVVILEIGADGRVTGAVVEAARGYGFDEAALTAAHQLVFEPARRAGGAMPSKIKFRYSFMRPAARLVGRVTQLSTGAPVAMARVQVLDARGVERMTQTASDGTWSIDGVEPGLAHVGIEAPLFETQRLDEAVAAGEEVEIVIRLAPTPAPTPTSLSAPVEVTVQGERPSREVSRRTLSRVEIAQIPGTNGDALRSAQNLPGVARPFLFSGALYLRGAGPYDSAVSLEGVPVPIVYHFGGLSSVLPTELVERLELSTSNYGSAYGRSIGGRLNVDVRRPRVDALHGMAQVDLIDARVLAEGPIADTGWGFSIAGRRSWFDAWLGPALKETGGAISTVPRYYDYQLELAGALAATTSLRVLFLGSDDAFELVTHSPDPNIRSAVGGEFDWHTRFWRVIAQLRSELSHGTEIEMTSGYGYDNVELALGTTFDQTRSWPLTTRAELLQRVARGATLVVGVDLAHTAQDQRQRTPAPTAPGVPPGSPGQLPLDIRQSRALTQLGAYTEWELTPVLGMRIVPGLRIDYDETTGDFELEPRISARQQLRRDFPRTTVKAAVGVYHQPPQAADAAATAGLSALSTQRAIHYMLGVEQELTQQIELTNEAYYKSLDRLIVPAVGNTGDGRAFGVEWLLRYKADERLFAWISYSISRSERRERPGSRYHLFESDQTHIFSALGSYALGAGWKLGARWRFVSGNPYTPQTYGAFDASSGLFLPVENARPFSERLAAFHALDVRVENVWQYAAWALTLYVDVQNVYNAKNAEVVSYNYNYTESTATSGLPILPSLGIRGDF